MVFDFEHEWDQRGEQILNDIRKMLDLGVIIGQDATEHNTWRSRPEERRHDELVKEIGDALKPFHQNDPGNLKEKLRTGCSRLTERMIGKLTDTDTNGGEGSDPTDHQD